jgi:hypothetical protein
VLFFWRQSKTTYRMRSLRLLLNRGLLARLIRSDSIREFDSLWWNEGLLLSKADISYVGLTLHSHTGLLVVWHLVSVKRV